MNRETPLSEPPCGAETLPEVFARRAREHPDRPALLFGGATMTYGELDRVSDRFARRLQEEFAVGPETLVAVWMERSFELVAGVFGILKAGGAFVPIDPANPRERTRFILEDCSAKVVLTQRRFQEAAVTVAGSEIAVVALDATDLDGRNGDCSESFGTPIPADRLMYVIYTSGSTGHPKGVLIEHGAAFHSVSQMQALYPIKPGDVCILKANYAFDVSVGELVWWFLGSASLLLLEPGLESNPLALVGEMQRHGVTQALFVPSMLQALLERLGSTEGLSSLKCLFLGGETAPVPLWNELSRALPETRLVNAYGPTEAAIYATTYGGPATERGVPIGKPIGNMAAHVLDEALRPVADGVAGELCLGGPGLARGYLRRPELNAKAFATGSGEIPGRLYRTGDLVRRRPDGNLEFIGRTDHQVKVRGYRVELGEIEGVLAQDERVASCAVLALASGQGDRRLVAFVVPKSTDEPPAEKSLRGFLRERLPGYMVPSAFVIRASLPLLANGKLDRKALADVPRKER